MSSSFLEEIDDQSHHGAGHWVPDDWDDDLHSFSEDTGEAGPSRPKQSQTATSRHPRRQQAEPRQRSSVAKATGTSDRHNSLNLTNDLVNLSHPAQTKGLGERDEDSDSPPLEESSLMARNRNNSNRPTETRSSKHAPTSMGIRKQVSRNRSVVDVEGTKHRDPRFASTIDARSPSHRTLGSYAFLPEVVQQDHSSVQVSLRAARKAEATCSLSEKPACTKERVRLERLADQLRSKMDRMRTDERERQALSAVKKANRERQSEGKAPWYLKKKERDELLLRSRFEGLEEDGGQKAVRKAMEKKRRKQASKEKKSRPR